MPPKIHDPPKPPCRKQPRLRSGPRKHHRPQDPPDTIPTHPTTPICGPRKDLSTAELAPIGYAIGMSVSGKEFVRNGHKYVVCLDDPEFFTAYDMEIHNLTNYNIIVDSPSSGEILIPLSSQDVAQISNLEVMEIWPTDTPDSIYLTVDTEYDGGIEFANVSQSNHAKLPTEALQYYYLRNRASLVLLIKD